MTGKSLSEAGDGKASNQPRVGKRIIINGNKYRIHPFYNEYGANRQGDVILIPSSKLIKGRDHNSGYRQVNVCRLGDGKFTSVLVHRFVYECYNGVIPNGMVICHINDDKKDNRLCNLQLITQQQRCKKSANFKNVRRIKATNLETNEISYFKSMSATQQHLGIHSAIVSMCCHGIRKSGTSKNDGCQYAFEYA